MKSKMGIVVLMALNLIACGQKEMNFESAVQASTGKEDCLDCGGYPVAQYDRLHYFHGGGYPPPHGDSTITDLTLERHEDSISVTVKTRDCKIRAKLSARYHDKLVYSLLNAKRKPYDPYGSVAIDAPYELVTLTKNQDNSPIGCLEAAKQIYLRNLDHVEMEQVVLEEADAEKIRRQLEFIVDEAGRVGDELCSSLN